MGCSRSVGGDIMLQRIRWTHQFCTVLPRISTSEPDDVLRLPCSSHYHDVHIVLAWWTLPHAELNCGKKNTFLKHLIGSLKLKLNQIKNSSINKYFWQFNWLRQLSSLRYYSFCVHKCRTCRIFLNKVNLSVFLLVYYSHSPVITKILWNYFKRQLL